ncbi:MAG: wax ester/triacylglycerol synthase family O-acyltransferase [Mycobacteriaceae bacterium]|nr:wax ester/triacylglycerol synthase family O-acyltransferase [Mycobacteriaceae bacterium]
MLRVPRGSSKGNAQPDNRLALVDQALFAGHRAADQKVVIQCVWVYEHAIDFDAVKRFHHNLGYGLLGRRIERSPLPFARHRWVFDRGPSNIEFTDSARPRDELSDWADECSQLPVDAESGPGWRLNVLPLSDGSTAVSLVVSHYLIDGLGLALVLAEAIMGKTRDLGYPSPRSRTRFRAVVQDVRQMARDLPEIGRAFVQAGRMARENRHELTGKPASQPFSDHPGAPMANELVVVPLISIYIDLHDWDARAKALGGTANTLIAALAAKLGERMGRRADDGTVTLQLPMSDRTEEDTRAIALSYARVSVDPTGVEKDLKDIRAAIKEGLHALREAPSDSQILWLTPVTPKRLMKRMVYTGFTDPGRPVLCSNLGDLGAILDHLDGTKAEFAAARVTGQHVPRSWLEAIGGQMTVLSGRLSSGKVFITVAAYHPGAENTKSALRELVARTLAEFDLSGEID